MIVYAESSAVLAWIFQEPRADAVNEVFERATLVLSSTLTTIECTRGLRRAEAAGRVTAREAEALLAEFRSLAEGWDTVEISERVVLVASAPFPVEPVRSLDAIHLASARVAGDRLGDVAVLSFDERVRANAVALGLGVLPPKVC
ncbi:MAG: type II toxin-antitoxin system VapC family toxin [Gemmatimonadota bacterium]|nr:type II toxin-antitoxin system VapC family toxin [Gemmatimonadota bacterium]